MERMEQIAKMFDLELGELFGINEFMDNLIFKMTEDGVEDKNGDRNDDVLLDLIRGFITVRKIGKPKVGDIYYLTSIDDNKGYTQLTWQDDGFDNRNYERGLVFHTTEGAMQLTEKILDFVNKEKTKKSEPVPPSTTVKTKSLPWDFFRKIT